MTTILGISPPDKQWKAMKKVYDACLAAGISAPPEVVTYFGSNGPKDEGVSVEINETNGLGNHDISGFEIDLKKLPKNITTLRIRTLPPVA